MNIDPEPLINLLEAIDNQLMIVLDHNLTDHEKVSRQIQVQELVRGVNQVLKGEACRLPSEEDLGTLVTFRAQQHFAESQNLNWPLPEDIGKKK